MKRRVSKAIIYSTLALGLLGTSWDDAPAQEWELTAGLTAQDQAAYDEFGASATLHGDTAVVGAFQDDDLGTDSGSVSIYQRDLGGPGNWGFLKKIIAADGASGDHFGIGVALDGEILVVGAYTDDDNGGDSGSAYVFERNAGGENNWGEMAKLLPEADSAGHQFGWRVAVSAGTIIVGARYDDYAGYETGAAYIFDRDEGGNWSQTAKLTASDGSNGDVFGYAVAVSGDTAVVGALLEDEGGSDAGAVYI